MMHFGGTLTLNGLVMYVASNFEKVLLGRFWGAQSLGLYGRAYQLIRIPADNLNFAVGDVAFSALSRIQNDQARVRRYFLKGYSLVLGLTVPLTIACALFAEDIVSVLLGAKWNDAAPIFKLLAPTILIFAATNPLGWLLNSMGLVRRGLNIALVIAPLMIASYVVGLPYGPKGVALAYSTVCLLWIIPITAWCVRGTMVSLRDVWNAIYRPLGSAAVAAGFAFAIMLWIGRRLSPLPRLCAESSILFAVYFVLLLFFAGQKELYFDLLRGFRAHSSTRGERAVSALEPESPR